MFIEYLICLLSYLSSFVHTCIIMIEINDQMHFLCDINNWLSCLNLRDLLDIPGRPVWISSHIRKRLQKLTDIA